MQACPKSILSKRTFIILCQTRSIQIYKAYRNVNYYYMIYLSFISLFTSSEHFTNFLNNIKVLDNVFSVGVSNLNHISLRKG